MRQRDWLVSQLPVEMMEDDFTARFVSIFQTVADTVLLQVDNLPHVGDVAVTTDAMVRQIGRWFGLTWVDPSLSDATQRAIVRAYVNGLQFRGTRRGLETLLTVISGSDVTVSDSGGVFIRGEAPVRPAHVVIDVPSPGPFTQQELADIIRTELPATCTFELVVGGRPFQGAAA